MEPATEAGEAVVQVTLPNQEIRQFAFAESLSLHAVKVRSASSLQRLETSEILAAYHATEAAPSRHLDLRTDQGAVLNKMFERFVDSDPMIKIQYYQGSRTFNLQLVASARRNSLILFDMNHVLALAEKASNNTEPSSSDEGLSTPEIDALLAEANQLLATHTPRPIGEIDISQVVQPTSGEESPRVTVVEAKQVSVNVVSGGVRVSELTPRTSPQLIKSVSLSAVEPTVIPAAERKGTMVAQRATVVQRAPSASESTAKDQTSTEQATPPVDSPRQEAPADSISSRRQHRSMAISSATLAQARNVIPANFSDPKSPKSAASPRSASESDATAPASLGDSNPQFVPASILSAKKLMTTISRTDLLGVPTQLTGGATLGGAEAEGETKPRAISAVRVFLNENSSTSTTAEEKVAPAVHKEPPARRPSINAAALRESRQNKLKAKTEATVAAKKGTLRKKYYYSDDDDSDDEPTPVRGSTSDSDDENQQRKKIDPKRKSDKRGSDKKAEDRSTNSLKSIHSRQSSSTGSKSVSATTSPALQRKKKFRRAKKRTYDDEMMRRRLNYGQFKFNDDANGEKLELQPIDSGSPWMAAKPVYFGDREELLKKRPPISIQRMSLMRQAPFFELSPQDLANFRAMIELKNQVSARRPKQVLVHLSTHHKAVLLELRLHESIKSVKERAYNLFQTDLRSSSSTALLLPIKDYVLELTESGVFLHDEEKELHYAWVSSRKERPEHLSLTEKTAAERTKELNKEISLMLDCPALLPYWLPVDNEQTHFRKNMSRNTVIQKRSNIVVASVSIGPLSPAFPPQFHVTVYLNASASKTFQCSIQTTAGEVMAEYSRKYKFEAIDPAKFLLRVCGLAEYVLPDMLLHKLEYVRRCLERRKRIRFQLVPKIEPVSMMPKPPSTPEPREVGVTVSNLPPASIERPRTRAARLRAAGLGHELFYPSSWPNVTPQWTVKKTFEVRIQKVESLQNMSGSNMVPGTTLFVEVGVYFGGELITDLKRTQSVPYSSQPSWDKILSFRSISVCNIPREARLCCSVVAVDPKGNEIPIAWVALNLFDYHDVLKSGSVFAYMWPNERANPIGVCSSNMTQKERNQNKLHFEFDAYAAPVSFTDVLSLPSIMIPEPEPPESSLAQDLEDMLLLDPLWRPTEEEKVLIWRYRAWVKEHHPERLAKLALCVPWTDAYQVAEMYRLIETWPRLGAEFALELLDSRYADAKIRGFAVSCLEHISDPTLLMHLLQLVQVLKYESQHYGALAQFLVDRACENESLIGIPFFWYLKAELPTNETMERFGLILEAFLLHCTPHFREEMSKQMEVLEHLKHMAGTLKNVPQSKRSDTLRELLPQVSFPDTFTLPLSPTQLISGSIDIRKCKCFDSAKAPLLICFKSADPIAAMDDVLIIFKAGDDLRQDALTVQMLHIMDQIWKEAGLDLHLTPYKVSVTSENHGLIEVVQDSTTTARIQREAGGATAAFKMTPLANWLKVTNPTPDEYESAVDNFVLSTAGYCVATYVLGIGDRHNDNIMCDKYGHLFHIDFGHFLGNFKSWKGLIKREKAPFVLTPEFAYAMGGIDSDRFKFFCRLCCRAYNLVRRKSDLLINLFAMMLSTGIPELRSDEDLLYLQDALAQELTDDEAAELFMELIEQSLNSKATELNFFFHILAH